MEESTTTQETTFDEAWIRELINRAHNEVLTYQTFLNKLQAQQNALVDRDILSLTQANREADQWMERAGQATRETKNFLRTSPIRPCREFESISQVIPLVRNEYAERLKKIREELVRVLHEIRSRNRVTSYLLEKTIDFMNRNMQILDAEMQKANAYDPSGRPKQESQISMISTLG